MHGLARRNLQPELMDQPGLNPAEHVRALRGLRRIHWWSRTVGSLWQAIAPLAVAARPRPLRVLDLACGGGDIMAGLYRAACRAATPIVMDGVDISPLALQQARDTNLAAGNQAVRCYQLDAVHAALPDGYDVIYCSLFLHHLTREEALAVLGKMVRAAARRAIVSDLVRSWQGYGLAVFGSRVLSRSRIVHVDGPRSVAGAFRVEEAQELALAAGWQSLQLARQWPQRFLMSGTFT